MSGAAAPAFTDRGQSDESRFVPMQVDKLSERAAETVTLRSRIDALIALMDACASAVEPNWNGLGSDPVSVDTYKIAERFAQSLPYWAPVPEVTVYPDGAIEFEWYAGPQSVFAVSVSSSDLLNYAGLFGARTAHGTIRFVDEFPAEFQSRLRDLFGLK
jgi:hypothetical protein